MKFQKLNLKTKEGRDTSDIIYKSDKN